MTDPITITVQLDLDRHLMGEAHHNSDGESIGSGPTTLEDVVLGLAAQALVDRIVNQTTTGAGGWHNTLRDRVSSIRDETIRDIMVPMIEEAVAASIQPTNQLGEATCAPTTLRSIIVDKGTAYLSGQDPDNYRNPKRQTRLQAMIDDAVDRAFTRELQAAIDAGKAEALGAVRAAAADVVAGTIAAAAANPRSPSA